MTSQEILRRQIELKNSKCPEETPAMVYTVPLLLFYKVGFDLN